MTEVTLNTRITQKIDSSANWASSNLILLAGEVAIDSTLNKIKIGDGTHKFSELPWAYATVGAAQPTTTNLREVGHIWYYDNKMWVCVANSGTASTWKRMATFDDLSGLSYGDMLRSAYDTNNNGKVDTAEKVDHSMVIKVSGGSTEGTSKYTFDGSASKELNIVSGSDNVTVSATAGQISVAVDNPSGVTTLPNNGGKVVTGATTTSGTTTLSTTDASDLVLTGYASAVASGDIAASDTVESAINKLIAKINSKLSLSGGTMTGDLTLANAPTSNLHAATKAYVDGIVAAANALVYAGTISGGTTGAYGALTPAAKCGDLYVVSVAGNINGVAVEVGDMLICNTDGTSAATSSNYSTVNSKWNYIQRNIDGAVTADSVLTTDSIIFGDGNTKVKSSGKTIATTVTNDDTKVPTAGAIVDYAQPINDTLTSLSTLGDASTAVTGNGYLTLGNGQVFASQNISISHLAPIMNDTLLGNNTGASAAPIALKAPAIRDMINVADGANNYVHPESGDAGSYGTGNSSLDFGGSFSVPLITVDSYGHVTSGASSSIVLPSHVFSAVQKGLVPIATGTGIENKVLGNTGWRNVTTDILTQGVNTLILNGGNATN